jgi:hypothetical protein
LKEYSFELFTQENVLVYQKKVKRTHVYADLPTGQLLIITVANETAHKVL